MSADDFGLFEKDSDIGADTAAPASDKARDEAGRFAKADEFAPQPEAKADQPPPVSEPAKDEQPSNRMVPLSELLSEREKRKAEATKREEATKQYEERLARIEREFQQRQVPQQQQNPRETPDPLIDPAAFAEHVQNQAIDLVMLPQLRASENRARSTHGNEVVDRALRLAQQSGADRYFSDAAYSGQTADPWNDMVKWAQRQEAVARIGPDPLAYEKQVREDERNKVIAEMKKGAPQQRFPGSLADATATGQHGAQLSDEGVAKELFGSSRNRRA
jgi:hypothetical protein